MSDIGLTWQTKYGAADFTLYQNDYTADEGLETSIMLSLFTDAGKWWGDGVPVSAGDSFGSRLYELAREKNTAAVVLRAPELVREALAWLVSDQVASAVDCTAEALPLEDGNAMLALAITVHRPTVAPAVYRFAYAWQAQES
jgi:phage gp46-like protein